MNAEELRERLREWWHVPDRYLDSRFENFEAYDSTLESRLDLVKKVAIERSSALLFGRPGVGKTHLAVSVMARWVLRGAKGYFVSALDFVLQVHTAFGNPKDIVSDMLDDSQFVVIDDLGAERSNETARIALLHLIDCAYRNRKRVVATSNLTPSELNQFEPRIISRLSEMGPLVEINAKDYRVALSARRKSRQC